MGSFHGHQRAFLLAARGHKLLAIDSNLSLSKKGYAFSAANTPNGLHLETLNRDNAMTVVMFPSSARLIAQPLRGELNDLLRRWNDAIATVRSRETVDGQDESWPSAP